VYWGIATTANSANMNAKQMRARRQAESMLPAGPVTVTAIVPKQAESIFAMKL